MRLKSTQALCQMDWKRMELYNSRNNYMRCIKHDLEVCQSELELITRHDAFTREIESHELPHLIESSQ